MSRPALATFASLLASGVLSGLTPVAWADCIDTPLTINFDAGSGTPHCYTESGVTVCASKGLPPNEVDDTLILGDNDGDTSPDLAHRESADDVLVYTFSMGGQPFAVTSFDYVRIAANATATFASSKDGYEFEVYDSESVTPDPEGWSGITSFTWTMDDTDFEAVAGLIDNLGIVAQCCGNGTVDTGEQCDDGNTVGTDEDGNCCTATCQFEASGTYCTGDFNFCTVDTCDGGGTCENTEIPNCNLTRPCGPTRPGGSNLFEHPKKSSKYQTNMVQAFVACGNVGGNSPSTTTEGGVPSCTVETPNERAGSPPNGWRWDETRGQAQVQIKAVCRTAADAAVKVKISGVVDGAGLPAATEGTFALILRLTFDDPSGGGNMTTVDLLGAVPMTLVSGKGAITTTVGVMLTESGLPDLPNGTSSEILDVQIVDPNGNLFAHPGIYNPES